MPLHLRVKVEAKWNVNDIVFPIPDTAFPVKVEAKWNVNLL